MGNLSLEVGLISKPHFTENEPSMTRFFRGRRASQQPILDTKILAQSLLSLEESVSNGGWDQFPQILALHRTGDPEKSEAENVQMGLRYTLLGEGDPYEILSEVQLDENVIGLLALVEGWAYPPDLAEEERTGPPSERSDRVEVRFGILLMKDGSAMTLVHENGQDAKVEAEEGDGPFHEAMKDALFR